MFDPCCLKSLREAFRIFDKDRSGYIEAKELIAVTTTLGQALTQEEINAFMKERQTKRRKCNDKKRKHKYIEFLFY